MPAELIDGVGVARAIRDEVACDVRRLAQRGIVPGLTVVLVGDDPASAVYVRSKGKATEEAGMKSVTIRLPADTTQADLLARVDALNADPSVHGILVQMPLPPPLDKHAVIEAIAPEKDVDGFHYENVGKLVAGDPAFYPCTPWGIVKILEHEGIAVEGVHAVVVGRSNIVGKPMAMMLLNAGATVTVCHSHTRDLAAMTRQGEILVVAVGRAGVVTGSMVRPGAVVIDVGVNRLPDGTLAGDVDYASVAEVASAITPVPGGVGPMTIAMLLANTVRSAERVAGIASRLETRIA